MDLIRWTILRRMLSNRQVYEMMVDFWSNLLHVPAFSDGWMLRASYDTTIRKYALGKFSDLLIKATSHPAMMVFLNSAGSTKNARQREPRSRAAGTAHGRGRWRATPRTWCVDSALMLTGYYVDTWQTVKRTTVRLITGPARCRCWAFEAANTDGDGRAELKSYLR